MSADLAVKEPCRVATTAHITLSGTQTIDGVSVAVGNRVLVRAQSSAVGNGIYVVASSTWSRAADFDGVGEAEGGTAVFVTSGTLYADSLWRVSGEGAITFGTSSIAFDPEFIGAGAGAVSRTLQGKARERVSVLDYGAVGDGTTDDSAAIQAAVDANKGKTILLPSGYTFLADGIALSGATYNGTGIVIEGVFLLAPSGGTFNWDPFVAASYNGIILHDVEDVFIDVPGMMDGNRTSQPNRNPPYDNLIQQHHLLHLLGVRRVRIAQFNGREVRGDGIVINTKTSVSPMTVNSRDIIIGPIRMINADDDGRNALTIVSGENILVAGGLSIKVGGRDVGGLIMPGGFDIEPDGDWHLVKNVRSGPWCIETAGFTGIAVLGVAITDDATQDWNVEDVSIANSTVVNTSDDEGPAQFDRVRRLTADVTVVRTGDRGLGIFVDRCNFGRFRLRATGVTDGVTVGASGWVRDSDMRVEIEDHDGVGLKVSGAERARIQRLCARRRFGRRDLRRRGIGERGSCQPHPDRRHLLRRRPL